MHAAALAALNISDVLRWQQDSRSPERTDISAPARGAEQRMLLARDQRLDERAKHTTNSVERFIVIALDPFPSGMGNGSSAPTPEPGHRPRDRPS